MRNADLSSVALLSIFAAACTASGSDAQQHGPVFDRDGGDATAIPDATADARDQGDAPASDVVAPPNDANDASVANDTGAQDAALLDANDGALEDAGSCTATTAVVAGGPAALFGAIAIGAGSFTSQTLTGATSSPPSLIAFGGGFQSLLHGANDALAATSYASTWSAPTSIPGALTIDTPALAPAGGALHAVYLGSDHKYYHATFTGSAWDNGADPVGHVANGGAQSIGPRAAAAASPASANGGGFVMVNTSDGVTHTLYDQSWTVSGGWGDGVNHANTSLAVIAPAMVALAGGASDLLVVYVDAGAKLGALVRDATQKTWSAPVTIDPSALSNDPPALAPLSNGRAALVYRGQNGQPYFSTFDPARAVAWSAPAALVPSGNPTLASPPSIATGVCGDDAVAVYVEAGGAVKATRFVGGAWVAPVAAGSGATFAAVATRP
jgi:hypothetical protein